MYLCTQNSTNTKHGSIIVCIGQRGENDHGGSNDDGGGDSGSFGGGHGDNGGDGRGRGTAWWPVT